MPRMAMAARSVSLGCLLILTASAFAQESRPDGDAPTGPQAAAPPPAGPLCSAQIEGQVSCQGNRLCECEFAPAVPARGLPARWRWDCAITRPQCVVTPESLAPHDLHGAYPAVIDVDRDNHREGESSDRPSGQDDGGGR